MRVERPRDPLGRGARLSNTWLTYPREGDNPGKLGLIPHRGGVLEGPLPQRNHARHPAWFARGWGYGPSW